MNPFLPSEYFDLSSFAHASLFDLSESVWVSLKKIGDYLNALSLGSIEGEVEPGAYLVNPETISIGKGSIVEAGAYIVGPCVIGQDCQIRHGAYMRGHVVLGNRCVVGHATEVKNSIFLDDARAGHFAYVGDSILGNRVNLGAGTKCANLRFDHLPIVVMGKELRVNSGLKKFGAILGDDVQTGCNSVTNPGTLMGPRSLLSSCAVACGVVPKKSRVKK